MKKLNTCGICGNIMPKQKNGISLCLKCNIDKEFVEIKINTTKTIH